MPERPVWRPPRYAWVLLGVVVLVATDRFGPHQFRGNWLVLIPVVGLGIAALSRIWDMNPAVPMCAAIALTIFSGAWSQIGLGGLPVDRLLLTIVFLQLVLYAPGASHTPRVKLRGVHMLMCIAIIYVLVSAIASKTLAHEAGFLPLFDQFGVAPYLVFLAAPAVFAREPERRLLLATLVGMAAYLGLTAIFESIGPHALVFPHYILNVDAELPGQRAGGPFQSSVAEGIATFACAIASAIAFTQWRDRRARAFAVVAGLVSLFGCFLTLERGVWIAATAGLAISALATRAGRRALLPGAVTVIALIGGALIVSPTLANRTSSRVGDQESVWARKNQTGAGLRMFKAKPLFGFGWDRYTAESLGYFRQASTYPFDGYGISFGEGAEVPLPLHNAYLAYVVELGLVGALLWLAVFLWGIGGAIFTRGSTAAFPWKLGLLAVAICFFVVGFFNPYQAPFPTMLLWVWAGVALAGQSTAGEH